MAKGISTAVFDAALDKIATCTRLTFCSALPANFAGIAAVLLASKTVAGGAFTKAADASGRKVTVAAQTAMTPAANGTITYACLDDGTTLHAWTTVTSQAVTTAQTWDSPAFKFNILDPT
jgi:hypothetical protein